MRIGEDDLSIFRSYKIYVVRGRTEQFDFPILPWGSYTYYAVNSREAVRLTRAGKEIERILAEEWKSLPLQDACQSRVVYSPGFMTAALSRVITFSPT